VAAAPATAQPGSNESLHAHLQRQFADQAEFDPDARYSMARADLNGDGREEALVLMRARSWCGTGGCTMLVLTPERSGWRTISRVSVTYAPVRLLPTRSRGWRDLSVRVGGGGIRAGEVTLRFNGRTYPSNPSTLAAQRARRTPGAVAISEADEGRLLYRRDP
jgi:putative lipoprotein